MISQYYTISGRGDLAFDGEIKPYIGTRVEFIKINKSGLYQVRAQDGTLLNIPKRNLDSDEDLAKCRIDHFARSLSDKRPTLEGWTIEVAQDIKVQHSLELENEMTEHLIQSLCQDDC